MSDTLYACWAPVLSAGGCVRMPLFKACRALLLRSAARLWASDAQFILQMSGWHWVHHHQASKFASSTTLASQDHQRSAASDARLLTSCRSWHCYEPLCCVHRVYSQQDGAPYLTVTRQRCKGLIPNLAVLLSFLSATAVLYS